MKILKANEEMPGPDYFINCPKCGHAKPENGDCIKCEGIDRRRETAQAASRRGDSERSTARPQGESEASGEEARALTGGPAKWREIVNRRISEARTEIDVADLYEKEQWAKEWRRVESELVNLYFEFERSETEGPAVSAKLPEPEGAK